MSKKMNPLDIANMMGDVADKKSRQVDPLEPDEDDKAKAKKKPGKPAPMKAKKPLIK